MVKINDIYSKDLGPKDLGRKDMKKKIKDLGPKDLAPKDLAPKGLGPKKSKSGEIVNNRPPVVTIMGHVDHGKTSLLDVIRGSFVVENESGGITQHISAFDIIYKDRHITFIDTPGHELFTSMRERGVLMTDIVLLIIALDDGVKPQTKEVIDIIKTQKLKTIVVFTKADLPNSNIEKIKAEVGREGILLEGYGGDTTYISISSKTKQGIDDLLDLILLEYDISFEKNDKKEEDPSIIILESFKDKNIGNMSLAIIESGILKISDYIYSSKGEYLGRIRSIKNDKGVFMKEATISTPVYIVGQNKNLSIGDRVLFFDKKTDFLIDEEITNSKDESLVTENEGFEDFFNDDNQKKQLSIILKVDTEGSLEAITSALGKIKLNNIDIKITKAEVGDITEEDSTIAKSTHSIILAFKVGISPRIKKILQDSRLLFMEYSVIYELIQDVRDAAESLIPPEYVNVEMGKMEISKIFVLSDKSIVLGGLVYEGKIIKNNKCKIFRGDEELYEGKIRSVKHLKDDVNEVISGRECGIILNPTFEDVKERDIVVNYKVEKV